MAFFEELGKKISDVSQSTVQKGKDFAEVQKLNLTISEEQKKINNAYIELGKFYFAKFKNNADAEMAANITTITEGETKIETLKKQIVEIKGVRPCPKCGADVTNNSAFCNSCGAKLTAETENATATTEEKAENTAQESVVEEAVCKNCGEKLSNGAAFCTSCGTKVE